MWNVDSSAELTSCEKTNINSVPLLKVSMITKNAMENNEFKLRRQTILTTGRMAFFRGRAWGIG